MRAPKNMATVNAACMRMLTAAIPTKTTNRVWVRLSIRSPALTLSDRVLLDRTFSDRERLRPYSDSRPHLLRWTRIRFRTAHHRLRLSLYRRFCRHRLPPKPYLHAWSRLLDHDRRSLVPGSDPVLPLAYPAPCSRSPAPLPGRRRC